MATQKAVIDFVTSHPDYLLQTDFVRELFMIPDRLVALYDSAKLGDQSAYYIQTASPLYKGKLFVYKNHFYSINEFSRVDDRTDDEPSYHVTAIDTKISYNEKETQALCSPQDSFSLSKNVIANFTSDDPIKTTLGIFIANYLFLVYAFGDIIPYLNEEFTASKLEKRIQVPLLDGRVSARQFKDYYVNTLSLFGQSNEILCPNISEKTITIPKSIHDLREKLVADNKEALEAGDASVMADIEKQLITAYREYLKGDPSLHFLLKKKYFDVTLKKLFLTQGITEVFGSPGKFTFVENPMSNGWKIKDLPAIFNEVRSGSYSRAIETANGGVIAKLILRVLQDTIIAIPDCETTRGEKIYGTKDTLKDFLFNYVIEKDGSNSLITDEAMDSLIGKTIIVRTPGYCQATQGFCARCFGQTFEILGQKAFAPVANDFARNQTTAALKRMHGTSHSVVDISEINRYIVGE